MANKGVLHYGRYCVNIGFSAIAITLLLSVASARSEIVVETTIDEAKVTRYFQQGSSGSFPFYIPNPGFRTEYIVGTGTNGVRPGPFVANLGNDSTFTFVVKAPLARKIVIKPPSSPWGGTFIQNNISFLAPGTPDYSSPVTPTITFENLVGPTPTVSQNSTTVSTPDGLRIWFSINASVSSESSFTAIRYSFNYSGISPGNRTYSFEGGYLLVQASSVGYAPDPGPILTFQNLPVPSVNPDIAMYAGLTFPSTSNRTYVIQYVNDLNSSNWITLTNILATTTNTLFFDAQSSGKPKRFYQVLAP